MSEDPLTFVDMSGGRLTCYKYSITCQDDLLTVDNAQSHVTAFRPISEAARSWSDDKLKCQTATSLRSVLAWRWWYIVPVVMGNGSDNRVSSYSLHASETQQLSNIPMAAADATFVSYMCGVARDNRQPMTSRLATHPSSTTVKIWTVDSSSLTLAPLDITSYITPPHEGNESSHPGEL